MRNAGSWTPTKYRADSHGRLRANRSGGQVHPGSLIMADQTARALQSAVEAHAAGHLLDLGCGSAPLYEVYASRADAVVTIDWPASAHVQRHVDAAADLSAGVPLADRCVDCVVLSDVVEHLSDPSVCMREVQRVLRPGGIAVITTPFLYPVHEAPNDYQRFTSYGLEALCRNAGLEVVETQPMGGSVEVLADLVVKHLSLLPVVGGTLARAGAALCAAWSRSRLGLAVAARTDDRATLGHLVVARLSMSGTISSA